MSHVAAIIDPEIPLLQKGLAESVNYATQNKGLGSDIQLLGVDHQQEMQDALGIIAKIKEFFTRQKNSKSGSLSFVALDDEKSGKLPYAFPVQDLKALVAFGEAVRGVDNTQAQSSYSQNVIEPAKKLLNVMTVSAPVRKLRTFYEQHGGALRMARLAPIERHLGFEARQSFERAVNLLKHIFDPNYEGANLEQHFDTTIKDHANIHDVNSLLKFGETLEGVAQIGSLGTTSQDYKNDVQPDLTQHIHNLLPSLAPKRK